MKVFVTGASGFIGSAVVEKLLAEGHQVIGLARTAEASEKIRAAGASVIMGDLENLDSLRQGASSADGIIHTAFIHDFSRYASANEVEQAAIDAMCAALKGTSKPIVVSAGLLGLPAVNGTVTEESATHGGPRSSEAAAMKWAQQGVHASVVRLPPSVHDKGDRGFMPFLIQQARKFGMAAYPGDGTNRWPAVHRLDAATLFQRAVEKAACGALYNAVADQGIALKEIAGLMGEALQLPAGPVSGADLTRHFEWMSMFIEHDCMATSYKTQEQLGWNPVQIGLLEDLRNNYF